MKMVSSNKKYDHKYTAILLSFKQLVFINNLTAKSLTY